MTEHYVRESRENAETHALIFLLQQGSVEKMPALEKEVYDTLSRSWKSSFGWNAYGLLFVLGCHLFGVLYNVLAVYS